jgi:hypothetical protein
MNYDPDADEADDLMISEAMDDLTTENGLLTRTLANLVSAIDGLYIEGRISEEAFAVLTEAGTKEVAG